MALVISALMVIFNGIGQSILKYTAISHDFSLKKKLCFLAIAYSFSAIVVGLSVWLLTMAEIYYLTSVIAMHFVIAALVGLWLFKEHLSAINWCGLALIITGVLLGSV